MKKKVYLHPAITQPHAFEFDVYLTLFLFQFLAGVKPEVKVTKLPDVKNVKWMSEAIYALLMCIFQDQFPMSRKERQGAVMMSKFVV